MPSTPTNPIAISLLRDSALVARTGALPVMLGAASCACRRAVSAAICALLPCSSRIARTASASSGALLEAGSVQRDGS
jgi:hypothetical protein